MVVQTAHEAIQNARKRIDNRSSNGPGMCLRDTRGHLEIDPLHAWAIHAWEDLDPDDRVRYDGNPNRIPPGAPVWSKGSSKFGHIFLAMYRSRRTGRRLFATNDQHGDGRITRVDINWFRTHWGHEILGWGRELNRVAIPYLDPKQGKAASGKFRVRLSALREGRRNADVRILERRLTAEGYPKGRREIVIDGYFGEWVTDAVREFQRAQGWVGKAADGKPGPETCKRLDLVVVD